MQAGVRRQPHPAQRAEVPLWLRGGDVQPGQCPDAAEERGRGVDHRVVAPAERVRDGVARCEAVGARGDHLADRHGPVHGPAQRERGEVAGGGVRPQPQSQPRVDRGPGVAHQHLAGSGIGHLDLDDLEVVDRHGAGRVATDPDLPPGPSHAACSGTTTSRPVTAPSCSRS